MKKILSLLLAGIMLVCSAGAFAELEIPDFPAEVNWSELVDLNNYMKTVFPGAHRMKVTDGDKEYSAVAYIGENYSQYQPLVVIIPDSGMTAAQVLEEGGWTAVADANDAALDPKTE